MGAARLTSGEARERLVRAGDSDSRRPRAAVVTAVARGSRAAGVFLALAVALAACGGSSHPAGKRGRSEVRAEPVSTAGANPFTAAVGKDVTGVKPPPGAAGSGGGPAKFSGGLPGLYGGTRNYSTCDAEKLVVFLEHNPAKAAAWAATLGIKSSQIRRYVDRLTAVTLRTDTRVTNHGYVSGRATPIQAVLEAGTAVFVNKYGEPVVKCYCGNPLTPPILYSEPTYYGPRWSGFGHITIIQQTTIIIDTFKIYDLRTGKVFPRGAGTSGQDGPFEGTAPSTPSGTPPPGQPSTPTSPSTTESPSAAFSPSQGVQGDDFTLTASGFRPGATLEVTLTRPDGAVEHYTISVGGDGTGSHTFTNTANVVTGTYTATVHNPATGAQAQASVQVSPSSGP
jgi:hypothetical protein